jgi:NAD(P)-dependent dehydrogenase (short-subunit alcohol dehydrogenase family)
MEPSLSFARYPSLENAVVFVTGGASGIGEYMVRAFAEQGARVSFVDIAAEPGRALARELSGGGAKLHFEPCDLRDIDALRAAFANMKRALG